MLPEAASDEPDDAGVDRHLDDEAASVVAWPARDPSSSLSPPTPNCAATPQHFVLLRSAEPQPAADAQRGKLALAPDQPPRRDLVQNPVPADPQPPQVR